MRGWIVGVSVRLSAGISVASTGLWNLMLETVMKICWESTNLVKALYMKT